MLDSDLHFLDSAVIRYVCICTFLKSFGLINFFCHYTRWKSAHAREGPEVTSLGLNVCFKSYFLCVLMYFPLSFNKTGDITARNQRRTFAGKPSMQDPFLYLVKF